jgi:hypothetical protein
MATGEIALSDAQVHEAFSSRARAVAASILGAPGTAHARFCRSRLGAPATEREHGGLNDS